jgi:RNA polymerase-binding transcription factor DksA
MSEASRTTNTLDTAFLQRQRRSPASRLVEQERTLHELRLLNDEARCGTSILADDDQNAYAQQLVDQLECESLEQRTRAIIVEIRAAIERLDQGLYGQCLTCLQPINSERLIALPEVALCASCREGGQRLHPPANVYDQRS